jgi:hypothetical protein
VTGYFAPGNTNVDTGGEFARDAGEAGFPFPRVPILAKRRLIGRSREFATSVNIRVTRGHLELRGACQVARRMGRSVPAFAGLLHRGLRALREDLGGTWKGDDR